MARDSTSLEGVLERIVFFNEDNSYTVARLQVAGRRDLVTIVGNMPLPNPGETLRLTGEWTADPKFGRQFRVSSCLSVLPSTLTGIQKYLGSGLVKGIGPVMAERIVDLFGLETLDVIEQKPERLLEVEGIGPIRQGRICAAWGEQKEIRQVMIFLQGHGVSSTYAVKIFKAYGNKAISIVSQNPYRLALDINGIGFKTADRIAQNMGIDPGSQIRAEAGIVYVLSEFVDEGHVYFPYDELTAKAAELLGVDVAVLEVAISALVAQGRVVVEEKWEDRPVYLTPLHIAEVNVARRLSTLIESPAGDLQIDVEKAIAWVQQSKRDRACCPAARGYQEGNTQQGTGHHRRTGNRQDNPGQQPDQNTGKEGAAYSPGLSDRAGREEACRGYRQRGQDHTPAARVQPEEGHVHQE